MSELVDIPTRGGKDGTAQLAELRSYLKDTGTEKTYPDSLLIDLLLHENGVKIWQELVGGNSTVLPFTYDTSSLKDPINRVRLLTSDTDSSSLKHTDPEILKLLDVMPLRYVVSCINLEDSTDITTFTDNSHPLMILRTYLKQSDDQEYLDRELIKLLFDSGMNPFGIVIDRMERSTSLNMSQTAANTGNSLASIDGITFSNPTDDSELIQQSLDSVALHSSRSVYCKPSVYGLFEDGKNQSQVEWESQWYAV